MRPTLRRSCNACARSKLSCDLRKPKCSRCIKRRIGSCVYANEPLTLSSTEPNAIEDSNSGSALPPASELLQPSPPRPLRLGFSQALDPFDSYPRTRLPRARVQHLIQHFLSNIAFQYYPLDLGKSSNPFVVSWWPLALNDPALFHVSLQTASLDAELKAQNGFKDSEMLMADSIALVRQRVEDPLLACGDETIDSVVTLAAIEFGKGNTAVGSMHIEGVKKMVQMRGGIHNLKLTSPLTARMVARVSLVLMQTPQFSVQNDHRCGDAIAPIQQWTEVDNVSHQELPECFVGLDLEPVLSDVVLRLRNILNTSRQSDLSTTDLHDLANFILHRLCSLEPLNHQSFQVSPLSECLRYAVVLYMLIIHGPTYFTHAHLQLNLVSKLRARLEDTPDPVSVGHASIALWVVSVGLVASADTPDGLWFHGQAQALGGYSDLHTWTDILPHLEQVLWSGNHAAEAMFRQRWEAVLNANPSHGCQLTFAASGVCRRQMEESESPYTKTCIRPSDYV
ncbi:hypothetical protein ACJQWK_00386 [Exserohilum turcicum]|uniref:Zn(2)-C6 fungal-type domain-containing protein n=1 Tax=Exserohilum turcicum (strain 28A) TaxID=671987 RepID=R0K222_EXST2|nr:uncharacterized protein SETTUDRAFT_22352 [Exserohilum turcica Et28A]EOA83654.1 hypothetical protein SETTUDRAFT_22352 [Exserohilum turcica Et28A]